MRSKMGMISCLFLLFMGGRQHIDNTNVRIRRSLFIQYSSCTHNGIFIYRAKLVLRQSTNNSATRSMSSIVCSLLMFVNCRLRRRSSESVTIRDGRLTYLAIVKMIISIQQSIVTMQQSIVTMFHTYECKAQND